MAVQIQLRRDTTANWAAEDPVLAEGEVGVDLDTGELKVGDGVTAWSALSGISGGVSAWGELTGTLSDQTDLQTALDTKPNEAETMGFVAHGANATETRPAGFGCVTWIGSVEPVNAINDDVWLELAP